MKSKSWNPQKIIGHATVTQMLIRSIVRGPIALTAGRVRAEMNEDEKQKMGPFVMILLVSSMLLMIVGAYALIVGVGV